MEYRLFSFHARPLLVDPSILFHLEQLCHVICIKIESLSLFIGHITNVLKEGVPGPRTQLTKQ
jgi:hypothetical protein